MSNNFDRCTSEPKEVFLNQLLGYFSGGNYQAYYMPELYKGICTFCIKQFGDDYAQYRSCVDQTISIVGSTHHQLEEGHLTDIQKKMVILGTADAVLKLLKLSRTLQNREDVVMHILPDYSQEFIFWLENEYVEQSVEIVREVRAHFEQQVQQIINEERFLQKNTGNRLGQYELQAAVNTLANEFKTR